MGNLSNWKHEDKPELDLLNLVSGQLAQQEEAGLVGMPDLRQTDTIVIASDYGGDHKGAAEKVYSFLLTDRESLETWRIALARVRAEMYDPTRRFGYKDLGDRVVATALSHFLGAADGLNGFLFTLGVDKRARYVTADAQKDQKPDWLSDWRSPTYERMLRIIHTIAFLLGGLSSEGQNVDWVTDEDEIVANAERGNDVAQALACVCALYCAHKLGALRCNSTATVEDKLFAEDLTAIPDLAAGALGDFVKGRPLDEQDSSTMVPVPLTAQPPQKAKRLLDWWMNESAPLRRCFCEIGPTEPGNKHTVHWRAPIKLGPVPRSSYVAVAREASRVWVPPWVRRPR